MAKLTKEEFISSLKEMNLLEIKELVDAMKEEFGVDPSAVAVAAPGAAGAAEAGGEPAGLPGGDGEALPGSPDKAGKMERDEMPGTFQTEGFLYERERYPVSAGGGRCAGRRHRRRTGPPWPSGTPARCSRRPPCLHRRLRRCRGPGEVDLLAAAWPCRGVLPGH